MEVGSKLQLLKKRIKMQRESSDSALDDPHPRGEFKPAMDELACVSVRQSSAEQRLAIGVSTEVRAKPSEMQGRTAVESAASFKESFEAETTYRLRGEDTEAIPSIRRVPSNGRDVNASLVSNVKTITAAARPPRWGIKWSCGVCSNACIPVRSESRCLWYILAASSSVFKLIFPLYSMC
jgi:hypothetical protein